MADPEIFIVSRLNDCFGLDLTLVDFDEKAPGELLQLLLDVLAELDPRLRGDVRDRGAEAGAAGAADLLRLLKYPPLRERDDGARRAWAAGAAAGAAATIHPALHWLLGDLERHRTRAYVARFLAPADVPPHLLEEPALREVWEHHRALQRDFRDAHRALVAARAAAAGGDAGALRAEARQLEAERAQELGVEKFDDVEDLLAKADFVTLHLPKTPQTANILSAERIAKMKPGARLVNCARGGLVDEEAVAEALKSGANPADGLPAYTEAVKKSWVWKELYRARNMRPQFHWGMWAGLILGAIDTFLFFGHAPWTLKNKADHSQLKKAKNAKPIDYPKPDGKLTFDKLSSVQLAGTFHEEEQPCHLTLKDESVPMAVNWAEYAGPEARFCPAGVYEYVEVDGETQFQINGQNCIHCKTCDIKDPTQNINWVTPQGGEGPNYPNM